LPLLKFQPSYVVKCLYLIHTQLKAASPVVKSVGKHDLGHTKHTHTHICIYITSPEL